METLKKGDLVFVADSIERLDAVTKKPMIRIYVGTYTYSDGHMGFTTLAADSGIEHLDIIGCHIHWRYVKPINKSYESIETKTMKELFVDTNKLRAAYSEANETIKAEIEKRFNAFTGKTTSKDLQYFLNSAEVCSNWKIVIKTYLKTEDKPFKENVHETNKVLKELSMLVEDRANSAESLFMVANASVPEEFKNCSIAFYSQRSKYKLVLHNGLSETPGVQVITFEPK
jgi:hypothetical protein